MLDLIVLVALLAGAYFADKHFGHPVLNWIKTKVQG